MARLASGDSDILANARKAIASAQNLEQLRQAQSVVLPLAYGLSLAQTAQVIGVSPGGVCQLRRRFILDSAAPRVRHGGCGGLSG